MKVVIDTNVLISSFFGGKPREIIDLWKKNKIQVYLSKDILLEYFEVLKRFEVDIKLLNELRKLIIKYTNTLLSAKIPP